MTNHVPVSRITELPPRSNEAYAMTEHILKSQAVLFDAVVAGRKCWEVRRNDRQFQSGDHVILLRIEKQATGELAYTGHQHRAIIGWMLQGGQFGVEPGYCIFSLESAGTE